MFDERTNLAQQVTAELKRYFGDKLCETTIPRNIRLAEAPSHGKAALVYDPRSRGAESYIQLAKEIMGRQAVEIAADISTADDTETTGESHQGAAAGEAAAESPMTEGTECAGEQGHEPQAPTEDGSSTAEMRIEEQATPAPPDQGATVEEIPAATEMDKSA